MAKKYYIKKVHGKNVTYKRYRCIEGWCRDKSICWQFSKQGALGIVERERQAIHPSRRGEFLFDIEPVE